MEDDLGCFDINLIVENVGPHVKDKIYKQNFQNLQNLGNTYKYLA